MKYLNLTEDFTPFGNWEQERIEFESFFFNGGEPHIKIDMTTLPQDGYITITTRLNTMNDLGMLMVATEALLQSGATTVLALFIPYFPGGRQDRRANPGEPFTAKVFANVINEMEFDFIQTFDPHSDVTEALLENCESISNHDFVEWAISDIVCNSHMHLIVPDAGASKKMHSLNKHLNFSSIVQCGKVRDTQTGKLSGFEVYTDDLEGHDCIIVDDICDGGGTFIGLAEALKEKNAGKLFLIVSHGIFSKGFKELAKHFSSIYTTDSRASEYGWKTPQDEKGSEIVTIINLEDVI